MVKKTLLNIAAILAVGIFIAFLCLPIFFKSWMTQIHEPLMQNEVTDFSSSIEEQDEKIISIFNKLDRIFCTLEIHRILKTENEKNATEVSNMLLFLKKEIDICPVDINQSNLKNIEKILNKKD